jgi:hypothetical protein
MRAAWLLCLIALSCARRGGPGAPHDGAGVGEPPKRQAGEALLLGNVQRLGTKSCKTWDDEAWSDVHWRAGLVTLEGNTSGVERLVGKPVLLFGEVAKPGGPELPRISETCPPIQSRSDWIDAPDGMILRRDAGAGIAAFRVRASHAINPLKARHSADTLAIELVNPLEVAIEAAAITVHYEGCFRKPMPRGERRDLGVLAPGARAQAPVPAFPADAAPDSEDRYRPVSVQVHGKAPNVYFDLDLRLSALGIELSCPKR